MLTITTAQLTLVEGQPEMVGEASTMGLAPGEWPDFIAVTRPGEQEGFLFLRQRTLLDGSQRYQTRDGRFTLTVLND